MHRISSAVANALVLTAWLVCAQAAAAPASGPSNPLSDELAAQREAFAGLSPTIANSFNDVESVVVVHSGHVIFEYYKSGSNQDTLRSTESVTKSVLSLLVGIA